jgi:hypothetical protein
MSGLIASPSKVLLSGEDQVTDGSGQEDNGTPQREVGKEEDSGERLHRNNTSDGQQSKEEEGQQEADAGSETQPLLARATDAGIVPLFGDANDTNFDPLFEASDCEENDASDYMREEFEFGRKEYARQKESDSQQEAEDPLSAEEDEELDQMIRSRHRDMMFSDGGPSCGIGSGLSFQVWRILVMAFIAFLMRQWRIMNSENMTNQ